MTRILSLLAATAIVAFAALIALPAFAAPAKLKEQMVDPVYKISNGNGLCSASAIKLGKEDFLLTAAHCVDSSSYQYIVAEVRDDTPDHKLITASQIFYDVIRSDTKKDLALVKVRDPFFKPLTAVIADKLLVDEGSDIWVVGYPLGATRTITKGMFNEKETQDFGNGMQTKYRASANMTNGNSGGMLAQFNDITGNYELIGVSSMKYNHSEFMGLFVTLDDIREFLRLDVGKTVTYSIDQR